MESEEITKLVDGVYKVSWKFKKIIKKINLKLGNQKILKI